MTVQKKCFRDIREEALLDWAEGTDRNCQLINTFINSVCKHKATHIHYRNHHRPLWFEDCGIKAPFGRPVSVGNCREIFEKKPPDEVDGIVRAYLRDSLCTVLYCYDSLDKLFETEPEKFKRIFDKYNGTEIKSTPVLPS